MSDSGGFERLSARRELAWWAFMLLACGQFTIRLVWRGGSFLDLQRYADGLEVQPYQGRVLMSWILKWSAGNPKVSGFLMHWSSHFPSEMRNPYSIVLLFVNFVAIVLAILAGRFALEHLTGSAAFSAWGSLLLLYMSYFNLVIGYGIFFMPYDVVSLALFMICVWLILTKRYVALIPAFVLGTLNRETSIFIPIYLCLYHWFSADGLDSTRKNYWVRWKIVGPTVAAQFLLWILLRLWVQHHFSHNPLPSEAASPWFQVHLVKNLQSLSKPLQWPLFLSIFGFTLPLFIAKFDMIGDRALSRATAVILVMWALSMLLVGVIVEIRIFNELTAFLMPCIALILWNSWIRGASASSGRYKVASLRRV